MQRPDPTLSVVTYIKLGYVYIYIWAKLRKGFVLVEDKCELFRESLPTARLHGDIVYVCMFIFSSELCNLVLCLLD